VPRPPPPARRLHVVPFTYSSTASPQDAARRPGPPPWSSPARCRRRDGGGSSPRTSRIVLGKWSRGPPLSKICRRQATSPRRPTCPAPPPPWRWKVPGGLALEEVKDAPPPGRRRTRYVDGPHWVARRPVSSVRVRAAPRMAGRMKFCPSPKKTPRGADLSGGARPRRRRAPLPASSPRSRPRAGRWG